MPLPTLSGTVERHWDVMKRHIDPISSVNIALALASHKLGLEKSMGDPVIIKFEPSIACQLRCDCCRGGRTRQDLLGSKASRFMDINLYRKIMDEVGDTLLEASLYDEGEPLLCPDIVEMVKIAAERNVGTVISTNASFNPDSQVYRERLLGVADAGLDKMIIALDGLDAETHQAYRKGSNFYHVLANMQMLAQYVQENDRMADDRVL